MNTDLDQTLCTKYPKLFRDRHAPMTETCMCWGFDCGDGWYNIIDQLCWSIQSYLDSKQEQHDRDVVYNVMIQAGLAGDLTLLNEYYKRGLNSNQYIQEALIKGPRQVEPLIPQVVVTQVKEKFGTLRFYYSGGDDYISGLVSMAEVMSAVTCEECGVPGKRRHGGWIRTLCDTHEQEHQNR